MLPIERINRIKEIVTDEQTIKISELSKILNVSEMTIHRDLKPLIADGYLFKTFGGVSLTNDQSDKQNNADQCVICSRTVHSKLGYRIILPNQKIEMACCAHCGLLREYQLNDEKTQSICQDFLRQTTLSAKNAWFVFDTSLDIGCCQPQVLTFEKEDHAKNFIKGFNGSIKSFKEALNLIQNQ